MAKKTLPKYEDYKKEEREQLPTYDEFVKKKDEEPGELSSDGPLPSEGRDKADGFRTVMERSPEVQQVEGVEVERVDPQVFTIDPEETKAQQQEQKVKREEEYAKIAERTKPFIAESKDFINEELDKIASNQNYYTGAEVDPEFGDYPPVPNAFLRTKQVDRYKTTRRLLEDVEKFMDSPTDEGLRSFWKGISSKGALDLLSLGYSEMFDESNVADAAQKSRDGRKLTPDEELMLTTKYIMQQLQQNKEMPSSYNIGTGLAEMVPYVAQIALTKGIGSGVSAGAKSVAKGQLRKIVSKYGLGELAGAAASSPFTGIMWSSVGEKRTGELTIDDEGNVKAVKGTEETPREAIAKAWTNTTIELFTERFVGNKLSNLKLFGKAAGKTLKDPAKMGKFQKGMRAFKKQANWDGLMSEWGEEQISAIGQAITTGDASISDLLDARNQFEMFATIAIANGAFKAGEIPGYMKRRMQDNKFDAARSSLDIIEDQELKNQIINDIESAKNVEDLHDNLADRGYEQLDPAQQKAIIDFVEAKIEKDVIDGMEPTPLEEGEFIEEEAKAPAEKVAPKKAEVKVEEAPVEEIPVKAEKKPAEKPKEKIKEEAREEVKAPETIKEAETKINILEGEKSSLQETLKGVPKEEKSKIQEEINTIDNQIVELKNIQDEKRLQKRKDVGQEREQRREGVIQEVTEEKVREGKKDEVLKLKKGEPEKMGPVREEIEGEEPVLKEKGKPIRSVHSKHRNDEIRKAIQKVGNIQEKKKVDFVNEAQSVEELDFLISNGKISLNDQNQKRSELRKEGKLEDETGRVADYNTQVTALEAPKIEQSLEKEIGKSRYDKLKAKKPDIVSDISERLTRLSGAKFAVGPDGKKPNVVEDVVMIAKDLAELGLIELELGIRNAIEAVKKHLPNDEARKYVDDNYKDIVKAFEKEGYVEEPTKEKVKEEKAAKKEAKQEKAAEEAPKEVKKEIEVEREVPEGKKRRRAAARILKDPNIKKEIKEGLSEEGINYVPVSNDVTEHEAKAIINEKFARTGSHDQAIDDVTNEKNELTPRVRVTMARELLTALNKEINAAETKEDKINLRNKAIKVAEFVTEFGTKLGQGVQAFNIWDKLDTETVVQKFNKDLEKARGEGLTKAEEDKLRRLSKKVGQAKVGFQRAQAIHDMLAFQMRLEGINWKDVGMSVWYAHVLSGYTTQQLNALANLAETAGEVATSMIYNPKRAPWLLKGLFDGYGRGLLEAWSTLKTGYAPVKSVKLEMEKDKPGILEAYQGFKMFGRKWNPFKFHKYVPRVMSAVDTFFYHGLKGMRNYELAHMMLEGQGKGFRETNRLINEKIGNTKERKQEVKNQLEAERKELTEYYELELEQLNEELDDATTEKQKDEIRSEIKKIEKERDKSMKKGKFYKAGSIDYQRRYFELMEETLPEEVVADADDFAARGTFNYATEGRLGKITDAISALTNTKGLKAAKFIVPFTRIVSNVANRYLDWSPYGFYRAMKGGVGHKPRTTKGTKYSREFTREEAAKEYIKSSLGTLAAVSLYALASGGTDDDDSDGPFEITAAGTGDFRKNYNLKKTGWQPYSIRVGDKWYSYMNTPIAIPLQVIGTLKDMKKYRGTDLSDSEWDKKAQVVVWNTMKYFTDFTFLRGLSEFMTNFSEDDPVSAGRYFTRFAGQAAKGFVTPNLATQVSRKIQSTMDLPMKEADNILQQIYRDIPVARRGLRDMVNSLGEPVVPDTDRYVSEVESDPVWDMIADNNAWVKKPPKNLSMYDLDTGEERMLEPDEYYEYAKLRGQKIKDQIVGNMEALKEMKPSEVRDSIKDYERKAGKEAKSEVLVGPVTYGLNEIKKEDPEAFEKIKEYGKFFTTSSSQSVYIAGEERYMKQAELDAYREASLKNYVNNLRKATGDFDPEVMERQKGREIQTKEGIMTGLDITTDVAWAKAEAKAYSEILRRIKKDEFEVEAEVEEK